MQTKLDIIKKGKEYFNSLPKEQQELISNVFYTTIDVCNDELNANIRFHESKAYDKIKFLMIGHMLNNEYFDACTNNWEKY